MSAKMIAALFLLSMRVIGGVCLGIYFNSISMAVFGFILLNTIEPVT